MNRHQLFAQAILDRNWMISIAGIVVLIVFVLIGAWLSHEKISKALGWFFIGLFYATLTAMAICYWLAD